MPCDLKFETMDDSGIDSDPKISNYVEGENVFLGSDGSCKRPQMQQRSTAKKLQKKLEARIEQAKRIQRNSEYIELPDNDDNSCDNGNSTGLIPIQRLPVPQKKKKDLPLVDYWISESESEDVTAMIPTLKISKHKQELSDTFSIENLSDQSEDSLDLDSTQFSQPHVKSYARTGCFSCQCQIL